MSTAPLFPWIAEEGATPQTQEIKDPVSGASITLPRINGLTVNEVLFSQWAIANYAFTQRSVLSSDDGEVFLATDPKTITELSQFCHQFLCLRLGLAAWGDGELVFSGERVTPAESLAMPTADGQRRSAPLYLLYLIYSFWMDEQGRWASGKAEPQMLGLLGDLLKPKSQSTGENFTGNSSESTQGTPDSQAAPLADAPPTSSSRRSPRTSKTASAA
jgi:hypothetical protein